MNKRIGPKMEAVVDYVKKNPGCNKYEAGCAAWGTGRQLARMSWLYGPVNRAIEAGLVYAEKKGNRYSLEVI